MPDDHIYDKRIVSVMNKRSIFPSLMETCLSDQDKFMPPSVPSFYEHHLLNKFMVVYRCYSKINA